MLPGQEYPACKQRSRGREEGDAAAPLPSCPPSPFMTSSPQGGPVLKGNLAQFHRNVPWKEVALLRHRVGHRKAHKSGDWEGRGGVTVS